MKRHTFWGAIAVIFWLAAVVSGCAAPQGAPAPGAAQPQPPPAKRILGIVAESGPETDRIRLLGNQALTFTAVGQTTPLGVVLDFPDTTLSLEALSLEAVALSPTLAEVRSSEQPGDTTTARVEILMDQEAVYEAVQDGNDVVVSFTRPAAPETGAAAKADALPKAPPVGDAPAATMLQAITAQRLENGAEIRIRADGPIEDYASFALSDPDRIVYDLYGLKSPYRKEQTIEVNTPRLARVRHYADREKLRVVLDSDAENFGATSALPVQDGLLIQVGPVARPEAATALPADAAGSDLAWVNRIDFSAEPSGRSVVTIGTTRPVAYDLVQIDERRLELKLAEAQIPGFRRRPLVTTRFESAVDRVIPVQHHRLKDTGLITIELREAVPYSVERVDNLIMVHFDPSAVPPQTAELADPPEWQPAAADTVRRPERPAVEAVSADSGPSAAAKSPAAAAVLTAPKAFTGEKIALDFYETDIKNVFRILREVSGKNFAIDQDVRGTVTLTLDKPVPWDQVLELVLKMNQLGKTYEGDIIRIATLKTLLQEEKLRQDTLAEMQKSREQQKALEPLVTDYIAINYATVTDVEQKIKDLITKDYGHYVVDERNSQLIVTDTAQKIKEIRERVERLDRITPQVLIEARIVEATKNFSRQLGTTFGIGPGAASFNSDTLGGDWNLSLTSNFPQGTPVGSGPGIAFDFSRLVGSPLAINAAIDAAESEGETKIISSPRILTKNDAEAMISQGLTTYQTILVDGTPTQEEVEINLELNVKPLVKQDNRINMTIKVKKEDFAGLVAGNVSKSTSEATTELLVNDGETIVIGGITKSNDSLAEEGFPGLRKVPVLGWLFKSTDKQTSKSELMIFITPRIVSLEPAQ
jgi:type IV pilus assembly protein PilQ